jgi:uncharacterized membrane protein
MRMRALRVFVAAVSLSVLAAGKSHAAVSAEVCNETESGAWVAFGFEGGGDAKWMTSGWWWAEPNECTTLEFATDAGEIYVHANNPESDLEWQGTKSLCVSLDAFEFEDAESGECETKRSFKKHTKDADGRVTVTLRDEEAVRVAYNFTLCNGTDDYVSASLGNATGEGVSTDGWHGLEAGECQTFIRRGKADSAYFYAQTIGRQRVWRGDVSLCVKYHEGFVLDSADTVACRGGDSERLPFVKKPLVKGRGAHDLEASKARTFKYGLNLCNHYKEDIFPAVAHLDGIGTSGMLARGFWRLHPGECRLVDAVAASPVYLYAETDAIDKVWDGKDLKGCVRNRAFTFPGVDRHACNGEDERRAGFFKWDVSEGANVYKFE